MSTAPATPPPEWARHAHVWTAWPADPEIWPGAFEQARKEVRAMIRALAWKGRGTDAGDSVKVLAMGEEARQSAAAAVGDVAEIVAADYGDIWLRDTGPIFLSETRCARFAFNGWGGKYIYPHDDTVGDAIAARVSAEARRFLLVLEGGAIDWDGEGTVITTRECLLNPNRNPGMSQDEAERWLYEALGFTKVIWLDGGLANDHTDGHVDNIARFIAPGRVVCQEPFGPDDPNAERLEEIHRALATAEDARGRKLDILRLPSPGRVVDADGAVMPASHMNFVIGNAHVVMPTYANPKAWEEAVMRLQTAFATRSVWPLPAKAILSGGGAFHCITQQQPADPPQGEPA